MNITLNLKKRNIFHLIGFFIACSVCFPTTTVKAEPQIEVMHWWYRGGEFRAMQVLKDEFELRGGTWFDVAGKEQIKVLNTAVSRMAKGYAPTLVQWNSGWEVSQIRRLGLLNNIDHEELSSIKNRFIDNVMDMAMVNGELVAIPVNVHSENWLWYKPAQFPQSNNTVMNSWDNFLTYAEANRDQKIAAIAVGDEPWQRRILFNNILLGVAGQALFQRIYNDLDTVALEEQVFMEAIQTFKRIIPLSHSFGEGRWDQQISAVASNKALTVSMGDWAKGEFKNLGLKLGRDYDCIPAPGTSEKLILVMDVFALGKVQNPEEKQGQKLFLDIVTDRAVSEAFNYLKGSLSPLRDADVSTLDKCNKIAYQTLEKPGTAIKPHASTGDRGFLARIDHLITSLWTKNTDTSTWINEFSALLQDEHNKRNSKDQIAQNQ